MKFPGCSNVPRGLQGPGSGCGEVHASLPSEQSCPCLGLQLQEGPSHSSTSRTAPPLPPPCHLWGNAHRLRSCRTSAEKEGRGWRAPLADKPTLHLQVGAPTEKQRSSGGGIWRGHRAYVAAGNRRVTSPHCCPKSSTSLEPCWHLCFVLHIGEACKDGMLCCSGCEPTGLS